MGPAPAPPPLALCLVYSIRYPVPGIAIELAKTGPKWRRKVHSTFPKGQGPLLKEVIVDRFWADLPWPGCRLAVDGGWWLVTIGG